MNSTLLEAFRHELHFLREVGTDFAQAHPQYAAALAPAGGEADPFVERLLQGVAFLTAKTACRLDNEAERLAADVLHAVMPDLLAPLPPATVVQFRPLGTVRAEGDHEVPRGSPLRHASQALGDVRFQTVAPVQLLPLHLQVLEPPTPQAMMHTLRALAPMQSPSDLSHGQVLRVELRTLAGQALGAALRQRLPIYCAGDHAFRLWSVLTQQCRALVVVRPQAQPASATVHASSRLVPSGWHDDQALLPERWCNAGPFRLLREWAHWPERFLFGDLLGLQRSLQGAKEDRVELWWFVPPQALPARLEPDALRLFCTPVVNHESLRAEPIGLHAAESEYPVRLPGFKDKTHAIVGIDRVECRGEQGLWQELQPLHKSFRQRGGRQYAVRQTVSVRGGQAGDVVQEPDWFIAPAGFDDEHKTWADLMAVSLWTHHRRASHIPADDGEGWRLDMAAPVLQTQGVGPVVRGQALPQASTSLLRAAASRFDVMRARTELELAQDLQCWFSGISREFAWPPTRALKARWTVRRVPWTPTVVYAQGYELEVVLDGAASDERIASAMHVVAATICRQPGTQAFVVLRCQRQNATWTESVVWR